MAAEGRFVRMPVTHHGCGLFITTRGCSGGNFCVGSSDGIHRISRAATHAAVSAPFPSRCERNFFRARFSHTRNIYWRTGFIQVILPPKESRVPRQGAQNSDSVTASYHIIAFAGRGVKRLHRHHHRSALKRTTVDFLRFFELMSRVLGSRHGIERRHSHRLLLRPHKRLYPPSSNSPSRRWVWTVASPRTPSG